MSVAASCGGGWGDAGAWVRALLVSLSTVVLNVWLAHRISRRPPTAQQPSASVQPAPLPIPPLETDQA